MMSETGLGLCLIGITGLVSAFINTVAGGGSLLTLPVLMLLGIPPNVANGTNRLGALFQTFTAVRTYQRAGFKPWTMALPLLPALILGSLVGAYLATLIPPTSFRRVVGVVFALILVLSMGDPTRFTAALRPHLQTTGAQLLALLLLGAYAGFIQAGVGIWLLMVLPAWLDNSLRRANTVKVALVHIMMWCSLLVFAVHAQVDWVAGLVLALGSVGGGWAGARWASRVNERVLRRALSATVLLLCLKLLVG